MEARVQSRGGYVFMRFTAALVLAFFILLGLPVLVSAAGSDIVINEYLPDSIDADSQGEFIELKNTGSDVVDLTGWILDDVPDGGSSAYVIEEGFTLAAGESVVFTRPETGIVLNNSDDDMVRLLDDGGAIISTSSYFADDVEMGSSFNRADDGSYYVSDTPTPGKENTAPDVNEPPEAVIDGPGFAFLGESVDFSGEDSADPDNDELHFVWDFGDGGAANGSNVSHVYTRSGVFEVRLTAMDAEFASEDLLAVAVSVPEYSDDVYIHAFLPNPSGSDIDEEYIEVGNAGEADVRLRDWQLDDIADGGSKPYTIDTEIVLKPGEVKRFERAQTGIALNNNGDAVRLLAPDGEVKDEFIYDVSREDVPFERNTEGVLEAVEEAGDVEDDEDDVDAEANGKVAGETITIVETELKEIRELEKGTHIVTRGVVSVPPGVFGENVLYLAGSGIQVYLHDGGWPDLALGDVVEITGELSSNRGEARVKLAAARDIEKSVGGEAPDPHRMKTGEIDEDEEGWLVIISGEVTRTSGDTFYVDDGSGEIKVYIASDTAIDKPRMSKGEMVTITGVVSETSSGYRVLPRFQEDVRLGRVAGLTSFPATGGHSFAWSGFVICASLSIVWAYGRDQQRRYSKQA